MTDGKEFSYLKHMLQREAEVEGFAGSLKMIGGTFLKMMGARNTGEKHMQAAREHWQAALRARSQRDTLISLAVTEWAQRRESNHFPDRRAVG